MADPALVGAEDQPVRALRRQPHQRVLRRHRLRVIGVQRRPRQTAGADSLAQGRIVDHRAPSGVHQIAPRPHPAEERPVQQVGALRRGGQMEADDVTGLRQLVQGQIPGAARLLHSRILPVPGVVKHLAAVGPQPLRRSLADGAEAHQPHPAGGQIFRHMGCQLVHRLMLLPGPHHPVSPQRPVQQHAHQRHRQLRHGACVAPGAVAHIDAPLPGRRQVNPVVAHPVAVDQLEMRHPGDQFLCHRRHRCGHQSLRIAAGCQPALLRPLPVCEHQLHPPRSGNIGQIPVISAAGM